MMFLMAAIGVTSFVNVFFRAFQQLNVQHDRKAWVFPCSFAMSACEVFAVLTVAATQNFWLIIPMGIGAGTGCLLSMTLHKYLRNKDGQRS